MREQIDSNNVVMKELFELAIWGGYEPFITLHMCYCSEVHYFSRWMVVVPGGGGTAQKNYADALLERKFWECVRKGSLPKDAVEEQDTELLSMRLSSLFFEYDMRFGVDMACSMVLAHIKKWQK